MILCGGVIGSALSNAVRFRFNDCWEHDIKGSGSSPDRTIP